MNTSSNATTKQDDSYETFNDFGSSTGEYNQESKTGTKAPLTKVQLAILGVLCLGQFCLAASISLQAPFFPGEAKKKGMSATGYGFVFGAFELAVVVSSPVFGKCIVWVKPRFLINAGLFSSAITSVLFGLLDRCPPGAAFAALAFTLRILEGFACAATTTGSYTIVATVLKERVSTSFSILGTCFGLGLIVGPTLGGLLYQAQGFGLPFFFVGSILFFANITTWLILPSHKGESIESGNMMKFLADVGILLYAYSTISSFMYIGYYATNLEIYLRQFSLRPAVVGIIFVISGTIYGITAPFWGFICDKGADPILVSIGGSALVCTGLLLLGPVPFIPVAPKLWLIIVSLVIGGLGVAAKIVCSITGTLQNALARGFSNDMGTHGLVSALYSSTTSIGAFIGPSLGGYLWDSIGFRMGTVVYFSVELLFMILLILYFTKRIRRQSGRYRSSEITRLLRKPSDLLSSL